MNKKRLLLTLLPTSVLVIGVVLAVYFHLNKPDGKDIIVAEKDDGTTAVMIDNYPAPAKNENSDLPAANIAHADCFAGDHCHSNFGIMLIKSCY